MKIIAVIIILATIPHFASALSYSTATGSTATNIQLSMEYFQKEHGRLPISWDEVARYLDGSDIDEIFPYVQPSKRFAFLTEPVPYTLWGSKKVQIIMIMRSPFRDSKLSMGIFGIRKGLRDKGRYAIYQGPDGGLGSGYIYEDKVIASFKAAGVVLPTLDDLPPFPHIGKYYRSQIYFWLSIVLVISALSFMATSGKLIASCKHP